MAEEEVDVEYNDSNQDAVVYDLEADTNVSDIKPELQKLYQQHPECIFFVSIQ